MGSKDRLSSLLQRRLLIISRGSLPPQRTVWLTQEPTEPTMVIYPSDFRGGEKRTGKIFAWLIEWRRPQRQTLVSRPKASTNRDRLANLDGMAVSHSFFESIISKALFRKNAAENIDRKGNFHLGLFSRNESLGEDFSWTSFIFFPPSVTRSVGSSIISFMTHIIKPYFIPPRSICVFHSPGEKEIATINRGWASFIPSEIFLNHLCISMR